MGESWHPVARNDPKPVDEESKRLGKQTGGYGTVAGKTKKVVNREKRIGRREGYAQALDDFAIWKDGVQRIGCMDRDIKEIMREYDEKLPAPSERTPE